MKAVYKKILFAAFTILLIGCCISSIKTELKVYAAEKPQEPSKTDSVIAILLNPHIEKAITEYYGEFTQYALYDAKVISITQVDSNFTYKVTITVPTFHGPHNPPYGNEIMTFTVAPSGVTLDKYVHKDVKP